MKIKDAFQFLYGKWLAQSSRELRPAPAFLVLVEARKGIATKKQRVDLYMPLQPKRPRTEAEPWNIEVTTLEPQRVAYMRHVGPYDGAQQTWLEFKTRLKKDGLPRKDSLFIGVPLDNPKVIPPEKLRFDICATVDERYAPRKPLRVRTLAGGDYVVARNCPVWAIARGYETLFRSWLPKSGRQLRQDPSFLVTVDPPAGTPPGFGFRDIYVPLEPAK
jgi:AraC family transcriptional regulator